MLSFDEAYGIVADKLTGLSLVSESVTLRNSFGRISAEDIFSELELPGFDNAAMDGIVVKFDESISKWKLKGEISAGNFGEIKLLSGDAAIIMTGAQLPDSGDTVIPVEDVLYKGEEVYLRDGTFVKPFGNVRKKGQDLKKKELLLAKHRKIASKHILMLASAGVNELRVLKPLRAAVVATGDELIEIDSLINNDKVYASNLYTIEAMLLKSGLDCVYTAIAKDNKPEIREKISAALDVDADILVTSGGVSMGKYDHVQEILCELGAEIIFWKVNIKPGKPLLFAEIMWNGKKVLVFGLPGNPVSAFVTFQLFISDPLSEAVNGCRPEKHSALLRDDICKKDNKRHFVRGIIEHDVTSGRNYVTPIRNQSSSNMSGLSKSNALIVVGESMIDPKKGARVECIMI